MAKTDFIDLKSGFTNHYIRLLPIVLKGIANVWGSIRLFSSDRSFAHVTLSYLRQTLPWQPQNQKLYLPRSISVYGVCQMTFRESLRDIEACLRAQQGKLYHMGIRGIVSRNTFFPFI